MPGCPAQERNELTISMNELPFGKRAKVLSLASSGSMKRRLMDLGLVPGTDIERVMDSPVGDPSCYRVRGAMIALRSQDAMGILVDL